MALSTFVVATVGSIGLQIKQQNKIEKAQKEQQKVDVANQNEKASRLRRASIKEAMVKRAQIENIAGAGGQQDSSAVAAGSAQLAGDVGENLRDIGRTVNLNNRATAAQGALFRAQQTSPLQSVLGATQQAAIAFKKP